MITKHHSLSLLQKKSEKLPISVPDPELDITGVERGQSSRTIYKGGGGGFLVSPKKFSAL